ncbi:MAG: UDP-N-acetylglucosamine 2-epimerase (non-hydrolyzing) [Pacificimonas sp.]
MRNFLIVIGTRPEAVKLAPVVFALRRAGAEAHIVTTGQHPDLLPPTLAAFGLSADHALTDGRDWRAVLPGLRARIRCVRPDAVIVQGDTSSVMVGAMAASVEGVPVHHVEAGLRSGDWMQPFPEEHIRNAVTRLATLHFAPTPAAREALLSEGIRPCRVHMTGNTVIDALRLILPDAGAAPPSGIDPDRRLVILTMHRRETDGSGVRAVLRAASRIAARADVQMIYPVHPRTAAADLRAAEAAGRIELVAPIAYDKFLPLLARAALVITDSGGVQEEAAALGIPLICVRRVTERPEALLGRRAVLAGTDEAAILASAERLLALKEKGVPSQAFGDGHAAERIADILTR